MSPSLLQNPSWKGQRERKEASHLNYKVIQTKNLGSTPIPNNTEKYGPAILLFFVYLYVSSLKTYYSY